jgi:hypothetical protein
MKIFEIEEVTFERTKYGTFYGYKVMTINEDDELESLAHSHQTQENRIGAMHHVSDHGMYLANTAKFVLDYYSGNSDNEVLIKYEFSPKDVLSGNLTDKEAVITVSKALVHDMKGL